MNLPRKKQAHLTFVVIRNFITVLIIALASTIISNLLTNAAFIPIGEDCSLFEDDPQMVSIQILTGANSRQNVRKAYQSVVDMLDSDLQVIGESEKSELFDLPQAPRKVCTATTENANTCNMVAYRIRNSVQISSTRSDIGGRNSEEPWVVSIK